MAKLIPYTVEAANPGCASCKTGATWDIADPDGNVGGESYGDLEMVQTICGMLNIAFYKGAAAQRESAEPVAEPPFCEKEDGACCLIKGHDGPCDTMPF